MCALFALGLALAAAPAKAQVVLSDSAFNPSRWSAPAVYDSTTGAVAAVTVASGANQYRHVINTVGPALADRASKVLGVHIFAQSYSPAAQGAVAAIDFKIDTSCAAPDCTAGGQIFGIALRQGGRDYIAYIAGRADGYPLGFASASGVGDAVPNFWQAPAIAGWKTSASRWQASQFCQVSAAAIVSPLDGVCDASKQPDFSAAGGPIQCGFFTYDDLGFDSANPGYNYAQGTSYDNWSCTMLPPGSLRVTKIVAPLPAGPPPQFPLTVRCTDPSGVTADRNLVVAANTSSAPVDDLVPGSTCRVLESPPPPPAGCAWQPPVYAPAVIVVASGANTATVTNGFACAPQTGFIVVHHQIANPSWPGNAWFTVRAVCVYNAGVSDFTAPLNPNQALLLSLAGSNAMPYGTSCSLTEIALPQPFIDSRGKTCSWSQAPGQTMVVNALVQAMLVTNSYSCAP